MKFQTNRPASWQSCMSCGNEVPETDPAPRCKLCKGLLEVRHRPPEISAAQLIQRFTERRGGPPRSDLLGRVALSRDRAAVRGIGRFLSRGQHSAAAPSGAGPLGRSGPPVLKHEGHNPTGSFKDRGMTVGVTQAVRIGARAVACASTGNTSASLAAYAAQAGLPALVLVPSGGVATGKLAQTLAYGARTLLVRGDFDQCLRMVDRPPPSWRLPAQLDQSVSDRGAEDHRLRAAAAAILGCARLDRFSGGQSGKHRGLRQSPAGGAHWGLIARKPRLAAVQAEGAAPFARSFAEGFAGDTG